MRAKQQQLTIIQESLSIEIIYWQKKPHYEDKNETLIHTDSQSAFGKASIWVS